MKNRLALLAAVLICPLLLPADAPPAVDGKAAFDKLKMLVGSWEGTMHDYGKDMPATERFQLISGKSVLAAWLGEGSPYEMVTMIHADGTDLMATHYCAGHNQPRMVYVPGEDPNRLKFKFRDGTNIKPGSSYMYGVTFILDGPDHHAEEWVSFEDGKESEPSKFDFHRKK